MGRCNLDHMTGTDVAKIAGTCTSVEGGVLLQARRHDIYVRIGMDQSAMANNGRRLTTRVRRIPLAAMEVKSVIVVDRQPSKKKAL
jgi:hypothetical protein